MILTKGQENAVKKAKKWFKKQNKQTFSIVGRAGTGKSTVVFKMIDELNIPLSTVLFCTFVGKATLPLRMNGLLAKTIHSTIYVPKMEVMKDEKGEPILNYKGHYKKRIMFDKREELPPEIKLIVIDEAGMVPDNMKDDILSFDIPVIALGDEEQLPPVFGYSSFLVKPDVVLDEIMRQGKDSPIIVMGELARNRQVLPYGRYGQHCYVVDDKLLNYKDTFVSYDMIICAKNDTRDKINQIVRKDIMGIKSDLPQIGEKLVCRKNNWEEAIGDINLINGLFGYVEYTYDDSYNGKRMNIDFRPDFLEDYFSELPIDCQYLKLPHQLRSQYQYGDGNRFEYGYASTCHLVQGSQFDKALVIDESFGNWDFKCRWLYTAITRAKKEIVIVRKQPKKQIYIPKSNFFDKAVGGK